MSNIVTNINAIVIFLPRVLVLCLFLSFVRSYKCVTHTTFVVSGLVHVLNLRNGTFVPLVVNCNYGIPTVVTAQAVRDHGDHLTAVLLVPFISYRTELPVCVVVVNAFFTIGCRSLIVVYVCITKIVIVVLVDGLLVTFILGKRSDPFIVRLPPCHFPA